MPQKTALKISLSKAIKCRGFARASFMSSFDMNQSVNLMKCTQVLIAAVIILLIFVRTTLGVFVIQPIGAVPDGTTIVYWRIGTNFDFIESADGLVQKTGAGLSLFTRGLALAAASEPIVERELLRLPYSSFLYGLTTGGEYYDR